MCLNLTETLDCIFHAVSIPGRSGRLKNSFCWYVKLLVLGFQLKLVHGALVESTFFKILEVVLILLIALFWKVRNRDISL